MITLALRSLRSSTDHLSEASTITLIVSWNDAEDNHESVSLAIEVNHNTILLYAHGFLPAASNCLFIVTTSSYFACDPGMRLELPAS
jgi:hypothetical protein